MKVGDLICFTLASLKENAFNTWESNKFYGIAIEVGMFTVTVLHNGSTHYWPVGNCEKVKDEVQEG